MSENRWIFELKERVPHFLKSLKTGKPGYFCYSLSGDIATDQEHWGLGNTVFATKIYYTLNLLETLTPTEKNSLSRFILSFQTKNGSFFDPLVRSKSFLRNTLYAIRHGNIQYFTGKAVARAETRQAFSALNLLHCTPPIPYTDFPQSKEAILTYLTTLQWQRPWTAGSHFSHLLFFLNISDLPEKKDLTQYAIEWVMKLQNSKNGCWYKGTPSLQEKINGAMKIITGLKAANAMYFPYAEKLIDTCLSATNDEHACDNFNIIYVLKYANEMTAGSYRSSEIEAFCYNRLTLYKKYYFPKIGGFSFKLGKANDTYYGARITRGLKEPDIHGTVMFLWGIAVIASILGINDELGFNEMIP